MMIGGAEFQDERADCGGSLSAASLFKSESKGLGTGRSLLGCPLLSGFSIKARVDVLLEFLASDSRMCEIMRI